MVDYSYLEELEEEVFEEKSKPKRKPKRKVGVVPYFFICLLL